MEKLKTYEQAVYPLTKIFCIKLSSIFLACKLKNYSFKRNFKLCEYKIKKSVTVNFKNNKKENKIKGRKGRERETTEQLSL